ncbi:hypothetical protein [Nonomuraea angiospora]|uniref:hypothetical protein n=1 Tax=Nonomuraea angiospora TaxID=46172 RepID=UPI0029A59933|nr:hypothetical protein [Nonomuraea angiospora]MDX3101187.1 hypothetical protein [Nonomuraea angiospora]
MNFCLSDLVPPLRWSDATTITLLTGQPELPDAWWRSLPMPHVLAAIGPESLGELLTEIALEHWPAAAVGDVLPALYVLDPEEADEPAVAIALDRAGSWAGLLTLTSRELVDQPFIQARPVLNTLFSAVLVRLAHPRTAEPAHPAPVPAAPAASEQAAPAEQPAVAMPEPALVPAEAPPSRAAEEPGRGAAEPEPVAEEPVEEPDPVVRFAAAGSVIDDPEPDAHFVPAGSVIDDPEPDEEAAAPEPAEAPQAAEAERPADEEAVASHEGAPAPQEDEPQAAAPREGTPEGAAAHEDVPEAAPAPEDVLDDAAPQEDASEVAASHEGTPEDAAPQQDEPEAVAPQQDVPEAVSHEGAPEAAASPESEPEGVASEQGASEGAEPVPAAADAAPDAGEAPEREPQPEPQSEPQPEPQSEPQPEPQRVLDAAEEPAPEPAAQEAPAQEVPAQEVAVLEAAAQEAPEGAEAPEPEPAPSQQQQHGQPLPDLIEAAFAGLDDKSWAVAQNRVFTDEPSAVDQLAKLFAVPPAEISATEDELRTRLDHWLASEEAAPYRAHLEELRRTLGPAARKEQLIGAADWHNVEIRALEVPAWQFVLATLSPQPQPQPQLQPQSAFGSPQLPPSPPPGPPQFQAFTPAAPQVEESNGGSGEHKPYQPLKDVSQTRRCFRQPDGRWWLRIDVTAEQLAGGECALPTGFASYLGLSPGESRTVRSAAGELTMTWHGKPVLESIERLLVDVGAREGGHLFLTLSDEGVLRARHLPVAAQGAEKITKALRLVGYTAPGGTRDQAARVIATRIGMTGPVALPDLLTRLRERGDRDLLALLD